MKKIAAERINSLLYRLERDSAMSCAVGARDTSGECSEIIRYLQSRLEELNQKVTALQQENASLKDDAVRYRGLRGCTDEAVWIGLMRTMPFAHDAFDQRIDAAMQANK